MTLLRVLQLVAFIIFSVLTMECVYWLLNQPSDWLLMLVGLILGVYIWVTVKTNFFTKLPFKR
ncbi:hypothetical protein [Spirosoma gilvum]